MDGKQDNAIPGIPGAAKENIFSITFFIFSFIVMFSLSKIAVHMDGI